MYRLSITRLTAEQLNLPDIALSIIRKMLRLWLNLRVTQGEGSYAEQILGPVSNISPNTDYIYPGTQEIYLFNLFMMSGLFYLKSLDRSISNTRGVWLVFIATMFYRSNCI